MAGYDTQKSFVVICMAPEAQIFQPHLQDELMDDPSLIFKKRDVPIKVNTPAYSYEFRLGKPQVIASKRNSDQDIDFPVFVNWLTGGPEGDQNGETDCYGLVQLDAEIASKLMEMLFSQYETGQGINSKKVEEIANTRIKKAMEQAEKISHERVMRVIKSKWRDLQNQYEKCKEQGLGMHEPTKAERLCQYVLREEIKKEREKRERLETELNETMSATKEITHGAQLSKV